MLTFSKMHGIGNDYIYINCFQETVTDPEKLSIFLSDVRFGIGSDGLVLILPSEVADFRMRIFNADGSEAMMCGNATRCIGKYVYDMGMTDKTEISLETNSGIKYLTLYPGADNKIESVKVDMGKAILVPKDIPVNSDLDRFIAQPVTVDGKEYAMTCVSMGNPHAIVFLPDVDSLDLEKIGPSFESHVNFPDRVNTEFVRVIDRHTVQMRVWKPVRAVCNERRNLREKASEGICLRNRHLRYCCCSSSQRLLQDGRRNPGTSAWRRSAHHLS